MLPTELTDHEKYNEDTELEKMLRHLEKNKEVPAERDEFYSLVVMVYRSEQIPPTRLLELMKKFKRFGEYAEKQIGV